MAGRTLTPGQVYLIDDEADYDGESLAEIWAPRIGALLAEEPPEI